jgi:hypothetical protein
MAILEAVIDIEPTSVIGAGPREPTDQRNGSRPQTLSTSTSD